MQFHCPYELKLGRWFWSVIVPLPSREGFYFAILNGGENMISHSMRNSHSGNCLLTLLQSDDDVPLPLFSLGIFS